LRQELLRASGDDREKAVFTIASEAHLRSLLAVLGFLVGRALETVHPRGLLLARPALVHAMCHELIRRAAAIEVRSLTRRSRAVSASRVIAAAAHQPVGVHERLRVMAE